MRVLFTGGSSPLGTRVLGCVLADVSNTEVWCAIHRRDVPLANPKLHRLELQMETECSLTDLPAPLDLTIHFAGVTHAQNEQAYWDVNFRGTMQLAERARELGCRRFVYISTRCASLGSGAYGESKRAAEEALQKLDWESLLILRPAELYGGGGHEGIDKFMRLAARFHVVPLLWGHPGLRFAPLALKDFIDITCALLAETVPGSQILDVCGPEDFNGVTLASRIASRYHALPLPLWWPALAFSLRALRGLGVHPVVPDQVARLVGRKTANRSTFHPLLIRAMTRFLRD
jgi:nucleoside-diphosphate-sugar epimerase